MNNNESQPHGLPIKGEVARSAGGGTCLFPGSFDPFTVGHANIVERGLKMFDKVVIGIGVNVLKTPQSEM